MKKVSAIIVTYNRLKLLKECLRHLLKQNYSLDDIFIINNNSTDNTKQYLNNIKNSKIKVLNMNENLGGAGGFSYGINFAFEHSDSSYFWIMDDDTMTTASSLNELVKSSEKLSNHFGFLCSNVRWWDNGKSTNVPVVSPNDWSELISDLLIKIKESTFVSVFIPRCVVKKIGLPIAEEFIWYDDTEYTHRISLRYPCFFVPKSIVFHKSKKRSKNENIFNDTLTRIYFYKFGYRNQLFFDKKYYPIKKFLKDFIEIGIILFKIPFKSKSHRIFRMYCTLVGLLSGIFFNPKVQFPHK